MNRTIVGPDPNGKYWELYVNASGGAGTEFLDFRQVASADLVGTVPGTRTARDLITDAMIEIGALAAGETASAEDAQFGLTKLNRLLDAWSARKLYVYNVSFSPYTLTPNHQPHTIGPSGDFFVSSRPVKIENANLILTDNTPTVRRPLNMRDDDWWANVSIRDLATTIPTDLYYSPNVPNGQVYLWPVPTKAYGLELETWSALAKVGSLDDPMILPPGYEDAVIYSLAESLCPGFEKTPNALLVMNAQKARTVIQSVNSTAPKMSTKDNGVPSGGRELFNYRNRSFN